MLSLSLFSSFSFFPHKNQCSTNDLVWWCCEESERWGCVRAVIKSHFNLSLHFTARLEAFCLNWDVSRNLTTVINFIAAYKICCLLSVNPKLKPRWPYVCVRCACTYVRACVLTVDCWLNSLTQCELIEIMKTATIMIVSIGDKCTFKHILNTLIVTWPYETINLDWYLIKMTDKTILLVGFVDIFGICV